MLHKLKIFKSWSVAIAILLIMIAGALGCSKTQPSNEPVVPEKESVVLEKEITLATTTSTQDSGLLDVLIPAFEKKFDNKVKVKVVAVGTGQAIQLGKDGNADVLLVHSRKSEDQFIAEGFGVNAWDVMYNQFFVVGPKNDPAKIASAKDSVEAFTKIANSKAKFISRGDDSGTHKKELTLWEKANVKPAGSWYVSSGQGMGETLRMAEETGGYTLVDEATYLTNKTDLEVLFKGDKGLFNPYGVILVKSTQKPNASNELIKFLVSPEGQKVIADFGKDKYGKSIFVPDAKKR